MLILQFALFFFLISIFFAISESNLLKKIIFFNIAQSSVILLFIARGLLSHYRTSEIGSPFYTGIKLTNIVDPTPQALMLTAIVVGFAVSAVAISLIIKLKKSFGTIEERVIEEMLIKNPKEKIVKNLEQDIKPNKQQASDQNQQL